MSIFKQQLSFMQACGQFIPARPGLNCETHLWAELILEEGREVMMAYRQFQQSPAANNLADLAKEAVDLIYVASGLLNNLGIDADAVWAAVHESNMAKVDPTTGKVVKRDDGKVLKPDGWKKPDILSIVLQGNK